MSFDAGAIEASLSIDTAKADADLDKIAAKVRALEDKRHVIKISAVFDDASSSKARTAFAALDNAISRDAMQRLRSSPQGSVLGALNALFSPHPVSGAPSPQQAASQGLLGKIFGPQGGGTTSMPGGGGSTVIRDVVTGQNAPQKVTVTQAGSGQGAGGDQAARDLEVAAGDQKAAADDLRSAADGAKDTSARMRDSAGRFSSAAGKAGQAADEQKSAARDLSGAASGVRGVFDSLRKLFGGSGGGAGGASAGRLAAGLLGGIGPGIIGAGAKTGLITAGAGSLLGALPALFGGISPLLAAAPGLAGLGALAAGSIKQVSPILQAQQQAQQALAAAVTPQQVQAAQQQMAGVRQQVNQLSPALKSVYGSIGQISSAWQSLSGSFAPVMAAGLRQVAQLFSSLLPDLRQFFAASASLMQPLIGGLGDIARSLLPLFTQAIRAAAPEIRPLLDGLGSLVSGLFPGLITLVRASAPAVKALGAVLGTLGADLGKMLAAFAPVLRQSVMIFQPLLDVISALFPVIGKLAAVFAQALGPVFTQFGSVIRSLLPALTVIGKVLGALAAAVLGDLVSAFTAVARLLTAIAPALSAFAQAFSSVFTVLENTGIFATLGDALENIVPLLANLINALLKGLTPILPVVIGFLSQLSVIMVNGLTQALTQLLPPLTQLATIVLQGLAQVLPVILPVLAKVFAVFTTATADAVAGIAAGLAKFINALPKPVLDTLAGLAATLLLLKKTGVITLGFKLAGMAQKLWSWLSGGEVNVAAGGMQTAADTMTAAAGEMQKAADTMTAAAGEAGTAGKAGAGAGGAAGLAGSAVAVIGGAVSGAVIDYLAGHLFSAFAAKPTKAQVQQYQEITPGWLQGVLNLMLGQQGAASLRVKYGGAARTSIGNWAADLFGGRGGSPPPGTIAGPFAPGTQFRQAGALPEAWSKSYEDFQKDFAGKITDFFTKTLPGYFTSVGKYVAQGAVSDWNGFYGGFIKPVSDFFTATLPGFFAGLASAGGGVGAWLGQLGSQIGGFFTKTVPGWLSSAGAAVTGFFTTTLPAPFVTFWGWLQGWGKDLGGFFTGTVPGFFTSLGGKASAFFTGTLPGPFTAFWSWLQGWGGDLQTFFTVTVPGWFAQFGTAVEHGFDTVISWLSGVPGRIRAVFSGAAGWLSGAGKDVMQGFLNGLESVWGAVTKFIGGIASWIKAHKGPVALDSSLLEPAGKAMMSGFLSGLKSVYKDVTGFIGGIVSDIGGAVSGSASSIQALMQQMAAARGWTGAQWTALNNVEMREAGYNLTATNPSSGAYGLAQFISGPGEYAQYGGNANTAAGQITAMLNYIAQRYGTPAAAWQHELQYGWYDRGGWLKPGLTLALNGTGRPEAVIPAGNYGMRPGGAYAIAQSAPAAAAPGPAGDLAGEVRAMRLELCKRLDNLTGVAAAIPRGTGEHVGYALGGAAQSASFRNRYPRSGA